MVKERRSGAIHLLLVGLAGVAILVSPRAEAFYPLGAFIQTGEYLNDAQLRYQTWSLDYMDTNGDGDISGDGEGVPLTLESGADGFTPQEELKVRAAFEIWESVPSSFMAFTYYPTVPEDLETGVDPTADDFVNYVSMETGVEENLVAQGIAVLIQLTWIPDMVTLEVNGQTVNFTGPDMLDADLVMNADAFRPANPGEEPPLEITPIMTHVAGYVCGLNASPLNNLSSNIDDGDTENIEARIVALRNAFGVLTLVGATPTMYPVPFFYDDGGGVLVESQADLSPDDIAGLSHMYPRGDQEIFFKLSHEARTQTRANIPSEPVSMAHVVLWGDTDANTATKRVPLFDTVTSLFEVQPALKGWFNAYNTFRSLETPSGVLFQTSYTVSCAPLEVDTTALEFTVFFDGGEIAVDSLHREEFSDIPSFGFDPTVFPAEVFREDGTLFGLNNVDAGTPLGYDPVRRKIVSLNSGLTLAEMLPGTRPMFGDQNQTCPLNAAAPGAKFTGLDTLRGFRDNVLFSTAIGTAMADAYYAAGPDLAQWVAAHEFAGASLRGFLRAVGYGAQHPDALAFAGILVAGLCALGLARGVRRRARQG